MAEQYVSNNGDIVSSDQYSIKAGNRGHLYGDGVFESIRVINGRAVNLENHIARMIEGMKVLRMDIPEEYEKLEFFDKEINYLLKQNHITEGGKVRISIDRVIGGAFLPKSNKTSFIIEAYPLTYNDFTLNEIGLSVEIYKDLKKEKNKLAPYKTKNALIYIMASIEGKEAGHDEMLITNFQDAILESSSSNLFIVSNGVLYTSGLEDGCIGGTMRMQIINLALKNNIKVYECPIMPQNLLVADEIFLTNAIKGVQWVGSYRTKRYFNDTSKKLISLLNASYEV
jgi:branched-chain amino acid aminotransferase